MKSTTGIIPQELNRAADRAAVLDFLRKLNIDEHDKKELLFSWARNVGLKLRRADYDSLTD
jgi:hypothetical protein